MCVCVCVKCIFGWKYEFCISTTWIQMVVQLLHINIIKRRFSYLDWSKSPMYKCVSRCWWNCGDSLGDNLHSWWHCGGNRRIACTRLLHWQTSAMCSTCDGSMCSLCDARCMRPSWLNYLQFPIMPSFSLLTHHAIAIVQLLTRQGKFHPFPNRLSPNCSGHDPDYSGRGEV